MKFLETHNLATFEGMERTYKYVTPILIHGGIPQASMDSFFEKVVVPLIERGYKEKEEIVDFLYSYRIRQKEILNIEELIRKAHKQLYQLKKERIYAERLLQYFNKLNGFSKIRSKDYEDRISLIKFKDFFRKKQRESEILKDSVELKF